MDGLAGSEEPSQQEEEMMSAIFEKFDKDKDGILCLDEFNALQLVTEGSDAVYNQEQLQQLLIVVNPDIERPEKGMPFADYRRLYVDRRLRQAYSTDVTRDHIKVFAASTGTSPSEESKAELADGTVVQIKDLQGAKELNGKKGEIVPALESEAAMAAEGRVIVKLEDGERVALKPANIEVDA